MILDQGVGSGYAQVTYLGVGWVWTWVSGEPTDTAMKHWPLEYRSPAVCFDYRGQLAVVDYRSPEAIMDYKCRNLS